MKHTEEEDTRVQTQGEQPAPQNAHAPEPHPNREDERKVDEKIYRMGNASLPRLIVEFSIPSIVGMLVNGSYNLLSSVFLGQAMGSIGLSVMTVATPIMILFMAISMLVGAGGNALAALRLGQGRKEDAERSLGNTVTLSLFIWAFVVVLVTIPQTLNWLLAISSATEATHDLAAPPTTCAPTRGRFCRSSASASSSSASEPV